MTATPPRLAVIITCWNYTAYVGEAIESVLDQKQAGCELIVIDDGSTDGSWDIICRYGIPAVRKENGGQLSACLEGLKQTTAPFILFLDADDVMEPGSIAVLLETLDDDVAKLQFSMNRIDKNGHLLPLAPLTFDDFRNRKNVMDSVLRDGTYATPPTSGNVFRRDVLDLLYEVDYDRAVDGVILFAAPFFGDIVSLSRTLVRYRVHDRNDSGLGRPLDARSLRRDLLRFEQRMTHLRHFLSSKGMDHQLVESERAYFHLERSLYLSVAEGRRISSIMLFQLLKALWRQRFSSRTRLFITLFFLLTALLPNRNARSGLAYRLKAGQRSGHGLIMAMLRVQHDGP
ncbi:glycosyltransferase [Allorhizobium sp. BGMRC 0089]|uniref:glycosyltransferase family 2 protein n=1 Tax=Allorhizobium sonneratiae TaxID=2934936 RepID=UPI00203373D0|nr:glycosyltransferase family 2 protein [Allorhizobium sonneratiae]MCM2293292.1 glycosyltransferase [Allorhizobium sonneratiae]